MKKIGFTTSIPVEVIFAAGLVPVDLNNVFKMSKNPLDMIDRAGRDGFPRNICGWIKGIYSAILDSGDIDTVIGVVEGDCSNSKALMEVLEQQNIKSIPFAFVHSRKYEDLKREIQNLINVFGTTWEDVLKVKEELDDIRKIIKHLDYLTYGQDKATGLENHIWQVSSSDFNGNYCVFKEKLLRAIAEIEKRPPNNNGIRIGYIGVPPIVEDFYEYVESLGARIVYNEVQRQFTMCHGIGSKDIVKVYLDYTYPYDITARLNDIKREIRERKIEGVIHYTQSFCFRGIEDIVVRKELDVPVLTFEADTPGKVDARSKLRLESFVDMLR